MSSLIVQTMDGRTRHRVSRISRLTSVKDVKEKCVGLFGTSLERLRLFHKGKHLEDGHLIFQYGVRRDDVVQIVIKPVQEATSSSSKDTHSTVDGLADLTEDSSSSAPCEPASESAGAPCEPEDEEIDANAFGTIYKVGDIVDVRQRGAWYEASVVKVTKRIKNKSCTTSFHKEDGSANTNGDCSDVKHKAVTLAGSAVVAHDRADGKGMPNEAPNGDVVHGDCAATSKNSVVDSSSAECNGNDGVLSTDGGVSASQSRREDGDDIVYYIRFDSDDVDESLIAVPGIHVRPRARTRLSAASLVVGQTVMVNYNIDSPTTRGRWYDCTVTQVTQSGKRRRCKIEIVCTLYFSDELAPLHDCVLAITDEVYRIEEPGTQLNINVHGKRDLSTLRRCEYECEKCKDDNSKNCRKCACSVCGDKDQPELQIMCDECDRAFHIACLNPPLSAVPSEDEWYCPGCKNDADIVKAGEKLKESKKKAKMPSANPRNPDRDWDKGMACSGLTKNCTLVPTNHFGAVPGVKVGTVWKYRLQASEAGVHRLHVAGIHGRSDEGAYSICLAGGYVDDVDNGDSFLFSGSGGRDLSGNKRTARQTHDQKLTRLNKALANNITDPPLNAKRGAIARDWKSGKPVRVVRSAALRKKSPYAPQQGYRYDGLYKVVRYWPEKGRSGFLVWRYELRRDDPAPAPWTKEGNALCKKLNLKMEIPEGFDDEQGAGADATKSRKRKRGGGSGSVSNGSKQARQGGLAYKLSPEVAKLIKQDSVNKKLWDEAIEAASEGEQLFLEKVQEAFKCVVCQDVVCKPITIGCAHNVCKSCLTRSFRAQVFTCPHCRFELGKGYKMVVNQVLTEVLSGLFPGYENGR